MSLKILFMGTPDFSVPILKSIHKSKYNLIAVYTQPPKKKFRGQNIIPSPVHQYAKEIQVPVRCPNNLDNEEEYNFIKDLKPDIVIVVAYGKILSSRILSLTKIRFINIHASILPRWRGAAPIQRAIMNMDQETGVSIMKIIPELDAGPVMKIAKIKITRDSNFENLSKKISLLAASTIIESIEILERNKEKFEEQNSKKATYAKKIDKSESKINWNLEARIIVAKINALFPNPGSWFELKGTRIKVIKAIEVKKQGIPGEIINKDFIIACSHNAVQILKLKKEGKNIISVVDFLRGNKLEVGSNINSDV
jgi:methionyl-tRNA formyltransferase